MLFLTFFIPEEKKAEIKQAADILDIVSEVVLLKKTGKNYVGLCPFHSEKTASFTVNPEKQIFYCFGCGSGGDVYSFLMKYHDISFPEAQRLLARRYGIELPTRSIPPEQKKRFAEKESLLTINRQAMAFFQRCLHEGSVGEKARVYLAQREMTDVTIKGFGLGYAPAGWNHLSDMFFRKRVPSELLEKSGLVVPKNKTPGVYDRFRDRIIFPIMDIGGRVIGFGGRSLDDSLPKYLNSPETPLYDKSRSLYGLCQARHKCREKNAVFIVEGYFDLLALHQHGFENAVATLGTALTPEHIRLLKGYAGRMILMYDSDNAGIKAAVRSVDLFMKADADARILILPSGYDPDSYLSEFGPDALTEKVSEAMTIMGFLIETAVRRHDLTVEGKIRILSDMADPIALVPDPVARSLYIKELSERIQVDESVVRRKITEVRDKKHTVNGTLRNSKGRLPAVGKPETGNPKEAFSRTIPGYRLERQIVAMMLQFPEILPVVDKYRLLEYFDHRVLKSIATIVLGCADVYEGNTSEIFSRIDDHETQNLVASLAIGHEPWNHEGCLKLIEQFKYSKSRREKNLMEEIKEAEQNKDHDLLIQLLKKRNMQAQQRH